VDRLTADDRLMLWPDEIWPQEIGALAVLDGRPLLGPSGNLRIEAVRAAIGARLHLVPRFRQLLCVPRRGLGGPLWVDAPAFDLREHVRVVPLPAPGDEAQLLLVTERLRRQRLDRSRPLWAMWLLPGLPGNRVGLFVKMHHAIADGVAGVATVGALLDTDPDTPAGPPRPWRPAPPPAARDLLADGLRRHAGDLGRAVSALARPGTIARQGMAVWPAVRELVAGPPGPRTSLDRVVGPGRSLALIRTDLGQVTAVAHAHGAKVNDVLLTITAGGLRGLFRGRGEPVEGLVLPIYVPVTLRPERLRDQARGNQIGQMVVPLPIGVPDPGRRLTLIAAETARQKAESHPALGKLLRGRLARRALLKLIDRQPVSLTSADVPGPRTPCYLAGARLLEVFPVLPLIARVSLGVAALSYDGQFGIMAVADQEACPDLGVFAASARDELRALAAAASAAPGPAAARP